MNKTEEFTNSNWLIKEKSASIPKCIVLVLRH